MASGQHVSRDERIVKTNPKGLRKSKQPTILLRSKRCASKPPYDFGNYAAEFRRRAKGRWKDAVCFAAGIGPPPSRPHQVEIHPRQAGCPACTNDCIDCCGRFLRTEHGLPAETLLQLYRDLMDMGIASVVLSGTHTDPDCLEAALLERLIRMGGPAWGIKLYTFGLRLDRRVQSAIVEAAQADPRHDSYVTFSKPTTDPQVMQHMCRPRALKMSSREVLRLQEQSLSSFFALAAAGGFPLSVLVNCRLTRFNAHPASLAELLRWFADETPVPVRLRITTDYLPTLAPRWYRRQFFDRIYLPPRDARRALDEALDAAGLSACHRERISFRAVPAVPYHDVAECFNALVFAAVSPDGLVYPCQGMAGAPFAHLAYGDLKRNRFPEIWAGFIRTVRAGRFNPIAAGCPHCAADCERQICLAMAAEAKAISEEPCTLTGTLDGPAAEPAWPVMAAQWIGT